MKETRCAKVISEFSTIKSITLNNLFLQQKKKAGYSKEKDAVPDNLSPALTKKSPAMAMKKYKMSKCSALLPIKCRDNQVSHKRPNNHRARRSNLEKVCRRGLNNRCVRQKDVSDFDTYDSTHIYIRHKFSVHCRYCLTFDKNVSRTQIYYSDTLSYT